MTRARWLIGGLIAVASLIVAGEALVTYLAERLVVGAVAVVVLMGVTVIGFVSLSRARRYVEREIFALGAEPPSGALYDARRAQLAALRQRGVSPDLDLLADATAAAEAERGYTGRYLVATTVLIGLVGTFGGLMETLARATPLLKGDLPPATGAATGALALLAGPLAGLHVTFGTSVVAILVTLALTLVQGDVTLHHERLLALLQERTRHVLVPQLWPAEESAPERTVRALLDLRSFVAESLATSAAKSAEKVASVVRVEVQRLVTQTHAETQAATAAQTAALERTAATMTEAFRRTSDTVTQELRAAAIASRDALTEAAAASRQATADAATSSRDAIASATDASRDAIAAATTATREAIAAATTGAREAVTEAATASRDVTTAAATASREAAVEAATASREIVEQAAAAAREAFATAATAIREETAAALATLASTSERTLATVTTSTEAAVASVGELRGSLSAQLEAASRALAAAATDLSGAVSALSPALGELAPQLGGLAAEVALLASRAESSDQANAVLDELVRLSEDVERLLAANPSVATTTETAPRETGS